MRSRHGFTLIEMLVALAITLIMMGAVATLFGVVSSSVSKSRALIETSDRVRAAREIIQRDLDGATASLAPSLSPETNSGYFEIIEGVLNDGSALYNPATPLQGDVDDVLMFTTSSQSAPFLGKHAGQVIESTNAEVIYFVVQDGPVIDATTNPATKLYTLYRRVLLVAPSVLPVTIPNLATNPDLFYTDNDLSARYADSPDRMIPNTLGDLTKRENRFAHYSNTGLNTYGVFPFRVDTSIVPQIPYKAITLPSTGMTGWPANRPKVNAFLAPFQSDNIRYGEDVLLTNVLAFDVQVYDPGVPIFVDATTFTAVEPNAPQGAFAGMLGGTPASFGAYADLGWASSGAFTYTPPAGAPDPLFASTPHTKSGYVAGQPITYDSWSLHYENDGIDNDNDGRTDLATNGLDDDGNSLIDDDLERDTMPPYSTAPRGIRIRLRVYEPSSQQVKEVEITSVAR